MGFVELLKRQPTEPYYLLFVTSLNVQQGAYYDLARIYNAELARQGLSVENFGKNMMIVESSGDSGKTLNDDTINELYNACDIGINTSDGEGFGLCQIEHLYTGAPQIVTDIGGYRSFLNNHVATFIQPSGRSYLSGTMPLGFWAPTFTAESVADAMEAMMRNLLAKKDAVESHEFSTWNEVCQGFLEDLRAETELTSK
jgi:hypothetical protein